MVRPLLAQISKLKPLLTISYRTDKVKVVHHSHPQTILNKCNRKLKEKLQKSTQALLKGWDAAGLYTLHTHCADVSNCIAWEINTGCHFAKCVFIHTHANTALVYPRMPCCISYITFISNHYTTH